MKIDSRRGVRLDRMMSVQGCKRHFDGTSQCGLYGENVGIGSLYVDNRHYP